MSYTVGPAAQGLPEVLVLTMPHQTAFSLLHSAAGRLIEKILPINMPVTDLSNLPLTFKQMSAEAGENYLNIANNRECRAVEALQMVFSDENGVFPWCTDFNETTRSAQPLLFSEFPSQLYERPRLN